MTGVRFLANFSPRPPSKFNAASAEFHGNLRWSRASGVKAEVEYRDQLNRLFVDAEDTEENRQFFIRLEARLKSRFQQLDVWLTVDPIEIL